MVWDAYRKTTYRILAPDAVIDVRIDAAPPELRELLDRHQAATWAFITAWNPQSQPLSPAENHARQQQLLSEVEREGWKTLPGLGIGDDGTWPPEESVLILGIPRGRALRLARRFDQSAIVYGERDGTAELLRAW